MSSGISLMTQSELEEISCYLQNLAGEFENINFAFKRDGCDLAPYLFCPESEVSEEEIEEFEMSEDEIEAMRTITTETYHDPAKVLADVEQAITLAQSYDEDIFEYGKEPLIEDLEELKSVLPKAIAANEPVLLLRA